MFTSGSKLMFVHNSRLSCLTMLIMHLAVNDINKSTVSPTFDGHLLSSFALRGNRVRRL